MNFTIAVLAMYVKAPHRVVGNSQKTRRQNSGHQIERTKGCCFGGGLLVF